MRTINLEMDNSKEYYAFISYKREDKKEAKRLQHALEYYRLPNHLRQENSKLPEYVRPIFRDMTDLEVGELSAQIHSALEQSHYLIVVCSPRAAESKWVNDEVEYFISLGKHDKIIPYIIEGIPNAGNANEECFPTALLTLSQGEELLGANINEVGKESATIRVISRMFNIRFDTLYQRYQREQKRKRRMWIGGAILIALLGLSIGGYFIRQNDIIERQNERLLQDSTTMAHHLKRIYAQNDSLASQNNLILSQQDSIEYSIQQLRLSNRRVKEERDNASRANWNLKLYNAKILAENAMASLRTGNLVAAKTLISQICSDDYAKDLVQMPGVELSIRKIYRELTREGFKHMYSLDNLGYISYVKFDKTGNKFYIITNDSLITKYDASTGTLIAKYIVYPYDDNSDITLYSFDDIKGNVYYSIDSTAFIKNIYSDSDNLVSIHFSKDIDDIIVSPSYDYIACGLICNYGGYYNSENYEWHIINHSDKTTNDFIIPLCDNIFCFSPDGQRVLADIADNYCIYNVNTKNIEKRISYCHSIQEAHFSADGNNIFIIRKVNKGSEIIDVYNTANDEFIEFGEQIVGDYILRITENPQQNRIILGDIKGNLKIFETDYLPYYNYLPKDNLRINGHFVENLNGHSDGISSIVFNANGTKMLTASYGLVCVWDVATCDVIKKYLNSVHYIGNSGKAYIEIINGVAQLYDVSSDRAIGEPLYEQDDNSRYKVKSISRNSNVVIAMKDSLVYVIRPDKHLYFTIPFGCYDYSLKLSIDQNGKKLAIWDGTNGNKKDPSLKIYDINNNTLLAHNESIYCAAIALNPKGEEIAISNGSNIFILYANTLVQKLFLSKTHTGYICSICYSPDGKYIISASMDRLVCLWNAQNGSLVKTFRGANNALRNCSMSSDGNYILATGENTTYIWNVQTGEIVEQLQSEDMLSFCQDVPNKMISNNDFIDFPSVAELLSFFKM